MVHKAIDRGRVDIVVVYKIDRLSRSLRDFGRLMDVFDRHDVSFVSVTQRFDTSSSMGKLTLNVLMSFAEFEREVIGERIRDKIAAHKRRGKHTGGMPILGFDTDRERKRLVVNAKEAKLVRKVFRRFCELGSTTELAAELNRQGHTTKSWTTLKGKTHGGRPWNKSHIYRLLNNPKYIGKVEHKGTIYDGEHGAIVTQELWDEAHEILAENHKARANRTRSETPALLKGLIRCGHCGCAMGPTFTKRRGKRYRYYLCVHASKSGYSSCPVKSIAAAEIEEAVVDQLRAVFRTPEIITRTFGEAKSREAEELDRMREEKAELEETLARLCETAARLLDATGNDSGTLAAELRCTSDDIEDVRAKLDSIDAQIRVLEEHAVTERDVVDALERLDPIWEELFPLEQHRIVSLLIDRVEVQDDGLEVRLRGDGLRSVVAALRRDESEARAG